MTAIISDLEKYKYIEPQQVLAYLIIHGWQQQQQIGDTALPAITQYSFFPFPSPTHSFQL
jgi:hypothetical protein